MTNSGYPLFNLLLARLLCGKATLPTPAAIRKDLAPLFHGDLLPARIEEVMNELKSEGLLAKAGKTGKKWEMTEAGRSRALLFLETNELPPKCNWTTIRTKFLVPKALGLTPWSEAELKRIKSEQQMAVRLLKRKYELAIVAETNLKTALETLVCQRLGFPTLTSLEELMRTVISREAKVDPVLPEKDFSKVAPRKLLGARKAGVPALREVSINRTFHDHVTESPSDTNQPLIDLKEFAHKVNSVAPTCPTGWVGDQKVFISHVWRHLKTQGEFQALDLPTFKTLLLQANRQLLISLSRADLVQLLDPNDVRESEAVILNAEFHFILIPKVT